MTVGKFERGEGGEATRQLLASRSDAVCTACHVARQAKRPLQFALGPIAHPIRLIFLPDKFGSFTALTLTFSMG
jgi:hypothetical protein